MASATTAIRGPVLTYTGDAFLEGLERTMRYESDAIVAMKDGKVTHFGAANAVRDALPPDTTVRHLGKDKVAVLGLVTTKSPVLESKDTLKRRIEEAAKFVPLERLALSPQCGFASTIEGNPLTEDDEKKKLRLCVETAREVWGA